MTEAAQQNDSAVAEYLSTIDDPARRADAARLVEMMRTATGAQPRMWGSIVGFGDHHYRYDSGREGDTFVLGFAARKDKFVLYLGSDLGEHEGLLRDLGSHKTGKGCLYIRRLAAVDDRVLATLLQNAAAATAARSDT